MSYAIGLRLRGAVKGILAVGVALAALSAPVAHAQNGEGIHHTLTGLNPNNVVPYDGVDVFTKTFTKSGKKRSVLYLKPSVQVKPVAPAIVILHYHYGNPAKMANLIEIGNIVRDEGVWAILPDAVASRWNSNPAMPTNNDDSGLIADIIHDATKTYPVDGKRVYVAGYSEGAFMALRFVCEHADLVAAGFSVSGAMLKSLDDVCAPSKPTPFAFINGTSDQNVKYKGSFGVLSAPETVARWAAANNCTQEAPRQDLPDLAPTDGTRVHLDTYGGCTSAKNVEFYTVDKGGHAWPGYNAWGTTGRVSYDIDGTLAMWDFIKDFQR